MSLIRALGETIGKSPLNLGKISGLSGLGSYSVDIDGETMPVKSLLPQSQTLNVGASAVIAIINKRRYIVAAPDSTQTTSQITVVIDV